MNELEVPDAPRSQYSYGIRETLRWRLKDPAKAAALDALTEIVFDWIYETGQYGPGGLEGSLFAREVRAITADLRHAIFCYEEVSRAHLDDALPPEIEKLGRLAGHWAKRLTKVADAIDATLASGHWPSESGV